LFVCAQSPVFVVDEFCCQPLVSLDPDVAGADVSGIGMVLEPEVSLLDCANAAPTMTARALEMTTVHMLNSFP
jgi:hypothetical protein